MSELLVDFITSLDGYASGEGWPGFWGLEGPEYLAWLAEPSEVLRALEAPEPGPARSRGVAVEGGDEVDEKL